MNTESGKTNFMFDPSVDKQWTTVNWGRADRLVARLQHRIVLAVKKGQHRKVRDLQRLLTKSLAARLIAVKRVAQENSGKSTAGVDGLTWTTPDQKLQGAYSLSNTKRRCMPLRRIYIPKSNGKMRPLGIPTIWDRAHQALWTLALMPIAEELSDPASYGFRPYRSAWDAYAQIQLLLGRQKSGYAAEWVLDADIEGFFDHLNHEWLLKNIPMESRVLRDWLKAGILEYGKFADTVEGTPQGGVISPILANLALTGMQRFLKESFRSGHQGSGNNCRMHRTQINLVRYADDFIVTGRSERQMLRVKEALKSFLSERGLQLSEEKTRTVHVDEGFDFLGWNFRRQKNGTFLGQISRKSIVDHKAKLKELIKSSGNLPVDVLIQRLNWTIRGWCNYHRCASNIRQTWGELRTYVFHMLWHWARKRHRNLSRMEVGKIYWTRIGDRNWVFRGPIEKLLPHQGRQAKIIRLPAGINPFAVEKREVLENFWKRRKEIELFGERLKLWRRQKGKCPQCQILIQDLATVDVHHVIPTKDGGSDALNNKVMIHEHCHYRPSNHSHPAQPGKG